MLDAARQLEQYDTVPELWRGTLDVLNGVDVSCAIYISVDKDFGNPLVMTNVPDVYANTDPSTDPFLSYCCQSYDVTATGPEFLPDYEYLPDEAKTFITRARASGFLSGIGLPMRLEGSTRFGGFNLGTAFDRATFESKILPRAEEFRLFCLLVHRRIEELAFSTKPAGAPDFRDLLVAPRLPESQDLAPREREVAYLVARGLSRKECARLCQISPHTVSEYLKSAYKKLGVRNRVELARVLTPMPTDPA